MPDPDAHPPAESSAKSAGESPAGSAADAHELLRRLGAGEAAAADQLLPLVYERLRPLAQRLLGSQRGGHSWQATELIHEAYLRLVDGDLDFASRRHFTAVACRAMRFALVDHARQRNAVKRRGARVTLDEDLCEVAADAGTVLAIDEALAALAARDPFLAQLVELRFFGGLDHAEVAATLDTSLRSVERGWRLARAWLVTALEET